MTQGVAETEDLKRRLEVAETELKLVLEGSGGQKEAEELMEGSSRPKEGGRAPTNGEEGETVQSQRSGRKRRGDESIFFNGLRQVDVWLYQSWAKQQALNVLSLTL